MNVWMYRHLTLLLLVIIRVAYPSVSSAEAFSKVKGNLSALQSGEATGVIVRFAASSPQAQRQESAADRPERLRRRAEGFRKQKERTLAALPPGRSEVVRDYDHLPMTHMKLYGPETLAALEADPGVVAVYPDGWRKSYLSQSLPMIHQSQAKKAGFTGASTSVAVIDGGIDLSNKAFGSCRYGGEPGCRVAVLRSFLTDDDEEVYHGTNVSAIVLGVAPATKIVFLDAGKNGRFQDSVLIEAIDWCIENQAEYNIVAMNMSLGGDRYTSRCAEDVMATPLAEARAVGIIPVVAAGNEEFTDSLASPACAPDAVSVGAVCDAKITGRYSFVCLDRKKPAGSVASFSNSSSFLDLLAPGIFISAGGVKAGGTSQAAPHVSGAVAVLRAAYPDDTPDEIIDRLKSGGTPVIDPRNAVVTPRLDLKRAIDTANYATISMFSGKTSSGPSVPVSGVIVDAAPTDREKKKKPVTPNVLQYEKGTVVTLTAPEVSQGGRFSGWEGCTKVEGRICTVTATATHSVTVYYDPAQLIGEAVENPSLVWRTGGVAPWSYRSSPAYSGRDSAQSGLIPDTGGESWVETTVTGPGTIRFMWKVSSERCCDRLSFLVDDILNQEIAGEAGWGEESALIGAGEHVVRWRYRKDSSVSNGEDAGWIDAVRFTP